MPTCPITEVIIPINRQRRDFDDGYIGELMGSIFSADGAGLLNPIVLRDGRTLVAGECRLRAISLGYKMGFTLRHAGQPVPKGEIPYTDFGALSPLQQMEAELAENAVRKDLTWQELVAARAAIHNLRVAQAEAKGTTHTVKDTAKEVLKGDTPQHTQTIKQALMLTASLADPAIGKAKTMTEALKVLQKKETAKVNELLAVATGKTLVTDRMQVFHADCVTWMKGQPDEQFDVILTDPPYGMGADSFGDAAGRLRGTEHEYRDDAASTYSLLEQVIPEFFRLAKPEAHLYLWCDIDLFHFIRDKCEAVGWWTHRTPLINIKREGGRVPWPEHGPRRAYEICLYAVKGKRPTTGIRPDVFESTLVEGNLGHGAQKPVEAYVELLKRSVRPGDKVFDAFAGTGTIFAAAHAVDCFAVGVEQEATAYGICVKRIGELK